MNLEDIISFAMSSAQSAFDGQRDYADLCDSIGSHRDNIRDTLAEYQVAQYEELARAIFDARVAELSA
jgi:hypothetical protein